MQVTAGDSRTLGQYYLLGGHTGMTVNRLANSSNLNQLNEAAASRLQEKYLPRGVVLWNDQ